MNWDDLRHFLAIARDGQILSAARKLGISQSKLSRRLATLETALGAQLVERTTRGTMLTDAGRTLVVVAERMENEALRGQAELGNQSADVSGTVRIGAPDGFGSMFLAGRIGTLARRHPGLRFEIVPTPRSFSLSEREADLAVIVGRPVKGRLISRKLTDYTLSLYAGRSYIDQYGAPENVGALATHRLVGHVDDLVSSDALNYFHEILPDWTPNVAITTAVGQRQAVLGNSGIGLLHDFMVQEDVGLIPVLPSLVITRSYWLVWHQSLARAPRVRIAAEMISDLVQEHRKQFLRATSP